MLAHELQAQLAGEDAGAVPQAAGVPRTARVRGLVVDGAAEFGVVGPRTEVDVVGPDRGPHVVDHAHLGVDVDGRSGVVLQAVHRDPVASGAAQLGQRVDPPDQVHGQGERPVLVREGGDDADHPQPRTAAQRLGEAGHHTGRPQVLVLQVDERPGPSQRLEVAAGDAALAVGGEGVAEQQTVRVGPQQLDGVGAAGRRIRGLGRQPVRVDVLAVHPLPQAGEGAAAERRWVLPAFAEDGLDVTHDRPAQGELDVVPRRVRPVGGGQGQ